MPRPTCPHCGYRHNPKTTHTANIAKARAILRNIRQALGWYEPIRKWSRPLAAALGISRDAEVIDWPTVLRRTGTNG